jgi:four helix bundle protein
MRTENRDLSERLLDFGADIIGLITKLNKTAAGRHIGDQLMRSATSCGANYEEARAAESRADFVHKMQVVLKELRESLYWLRLLKKTAPLSDDGIQPLLREANELANIFAQSVITAKGQRE